METGKEHKVALKVLRLSRPRINPRDPLVTEFEEHMENATTFSLPKSFGTVYVGEKFSCMLSISLSQDAYSKGEEVKLSVSAVIQPPNGPYGKTEPISIIHEDSTATTLSKDTTNCVQHIVSFEPQETGLHTLSVKVTYGTGKAERTFVKHYQFSTAPGLSVKTKLQQPHSNHPSATIEAQIENISDASMVLEGTELLPPNGWTVHPFPASTIQLQPKDIWQVAFVLRASNGDKEPVGLSRLSLSWRREPMGEKGFMTTGALKA
ncbi:hypothetical protein TRVA0_008S03092 [Trichomonascus vanleenenianus]|uniref:uncharacterized protein n=1 Tax=Trichomonascus vanleenenianus TaxID=2268995 RepID=UPI003ECB978D